MSSKGRVTLYSIHIEMMSIVGSVQSSERPRPRRSCEGRKRTIDRYLSSEAARLVHTLQLEIGKVFGQTRLQLTVVLGRAGQNLALLQFFPLFGELRQTPKRTEIFVVSGSEQSSRKGQIKIGKKGAIFLIGSTVVKILLRCPENGENSTFFFLG